MGELFSDRVNDFLVGHLPLVNVIFVWPTNFCCSQSRSSLAAKTILMVFRASREIELTDGTRGTPSLNHNLILPNFFPRRYR